MLSLFVKTSRLQSTGQTHAVYLFASSTGVLDVYACHERLHKVQGPKHSQILWIVRKRLSPCQYLKQYASDYR